MSEQYPQQSNPPASGAYAAPPPDGQPPGNGKKSKKGLIIGLIIGGVILLGLIIAGIVFAVNAMKGANDPKPVPVPQPVETVEPSAAPTTEPAPVATGDPEITGSLPLTENYPARSMGVTPYWSLPDLAASSGWTLEEDTSAGMIGYRNAESNCIFRAYSNPSGLTNNDEDDTITIENQSWQGLEDTYDIEIDAEVMDDYPVRTDSEGVTVDFLDSRAEFMLEGVEYTEEVMTRNLSEIGQSYQLIYMCPTSTYDIAEFDEFLFETELSVAEG